jgi:Kef-type K+ transport system membrane component KefB
MAFALSFFAPIYFVSMGMTTNYITNFDGLLVVVIFVAAIVSKVGSVLLGAKIAGMPLDRETWAIAFGLNARGATGIILAGVGRAAGVIDDRIFVAMVVMALLTSLLAGPMMNWLLSHHYAIVNAANREAAVSK